MNTVIIEDNTKRNLDFEFFCNMKQMDLKKYLAETLPGAVQGNGFVYYKGTVPILLVAHMDTVHKALPETIVYSNGRVSSPEGIGGDDRCGIYMIMKILQKHDCSVVFCEDEEIGDVGAAKFCEVWADIDPELEDVKYIIELDRRGKNDAVYYSCANTKFSTFVEKEHWKHAYGTCSDISEIAPELGIAAVNLSCGYYGEHKPTEYVVLDEMERNIEEVKKLIDRSLCDDVEQFEYISSRTYGYYDRYDDDYYWGGYYDYSKKPVVTPKITPYGELKLKAYVGNTLLTATGNTKAECWAKLLIDNDAISFSEITQYEFN